MISTARHTFIALSGSLLIFPLLIANGCGRSSASSTPIAVNRPASPSADKLPVVSAAGAAPAAAAPAASPPLPARPAPKSNGRPQEITFDTIKFEMNKSEPFVRKMLTPKIEALSNQPVRIRGFILPSFQQTGIKQFVLVRDNLQCCFGPGAALYDCIVVDMRPGKSAEYSTRPVSVTGIFSINELLGPDGKHLAIYHLDGDAVQ